MTGTVTSKGNRRCGSFLYNKIRVPKGMFPFSSCHFAQFCFDKVKLYSQPTRLFSRSAAPSIDNHSRKLACKQAQTVLRGYHYARRT